MDYTLLPDEQLLAQMERSDESALSELYNRYHRLVFSLALHSLDDTSLAEEVTQDVFMRAWEKAETYHPEQGKVLTWMISITRYRSIDLIRRRKIRPEGNQISWDDDPAGTLADPRDIEGVVESRQERQRVQNALASLPKDQRESLALAYFQGYSHSEIAQILGEPLGTVKTRIRAGMQKLRLLLEQEAPVNLE